MEKTIARRTRGGRGRSHAADDRPQPPGPALTDGARGVFLAAALGLAGGTAVLIGPLGGWARYAVPLLQAIPGWLLLLDALRHGRPWRGALLMLVWSLGATLTVIELTIHAGGAVEPGVLRGESYRQEMFDWIRTGVGAESDPSLFLPQHLRHFGLTIGLSFATAGLAGLAAGTVLLNYMNYYVGALVAVAADPAAASLWGWPVWSVLRVIGFTFGATAAAHLLLGPVLRKAPWEARTAVRMAAASLALVVADLVVKAVLSPHWRLLLSAALRPAGGD